ncbi:carboxylesterase-like protein [Purpureocillium lavendulum]|uniref:Carboxylesterase-like protein n=1 Tax=Purpureocillium lavendulum TaxID=1247861 RepID=A0AB34G7G5_9HYPO|nr:carboxylesterase-like protein [Purpureocillium lavendulum]
MTGSPFRVLVFSKTGGYRHASIPASIAALTRLASASAPTDAPFTVHPSEDASLFAPESLRRYRVIVLAHVSGTFLTELQLDALQSFVRQGGGVVGVHTASVGMPPPPPPPDADGAVDEGGWYRRMVGASFAGHPEPQEGVVRVEDARHPIMTLGLQGLGDGLKTFDGQTRQRTWFDEWYNFKENPRTSRVHVLLSVDEASYEGGALGDDHPLVWCHEFEGGRVFHTALGHFDEAYEDEMFLGQLLNGILWAAKAI